MAKSFSTMKTNVGNNVQDTSAEFATIIGTYLNNRYKAIRKRANFNIINDTYSFSTVAGTANYTLPSTFGKELYVRDATNKTNLSYISIQDLVQNNTTTLTSGGTATKYSIYENFSNPTRVKLMKLHLVPNSVVTIEAPHIIEPADLSAESDVAMFDCDDAIELGATADAWAYKRQFAKSSYFEGLFEKALQTIIWDRANQPNQVTTFGVLAYPRD
jgi:hypothetical protein